jgi:hypothetical protein
MSISPQCVALPGQLRYCTMALWCRGTVILWVLAKACTPIDKGVVLPLVSGSLIIYTFGNRWTLEKGQGGCQYSGHTAVLALKEGQGGQMPPDVSKNATTSFAAQ